MKRNFLVLSVLILSSFIQSTYTTSTTVLINSLNGIGLTSQQVAYFTGLINQQKCTTPRDVLNSMNALEIQYQSDYTAAVNYCSIKYPTDNTGSTYNIDKLNTLNATCLSNIVIPAQTKDSALCTSIKTYADQNKLQFP
ncbi:hypothetical protein EBU24_03930 [bacterium]|nr:hypothetical protein [bacterium]